MFRQDGDTRAAADGDFYAGVMRISLGRASHDAISSLRCAERHSLLVEAFPRARCTRRVVSFSAMILESPRRR